MNAGQGVLPDGAHCEDGAAADGVAGGADSAGRVAADVEDADGVRRQLATAAELAAAQLARELDAALRRHAAALEARADPHPPVREMSCADDVARSSASP